MDIATERELFDNYSSLFPPPIPEEKRWVLKLRPMDKVLTPYCAKGGYKAFHSDPTREQLLERCDAVTVLGVYMSAMFSSGVGVGVELKSGYRTELDAGWLHSVGLLSTAPPAEETVTE